MYLDKGAKIFIMTSGNNHANNNNYKLLIGVTVALLVIVSISVIFFMSIGTDQSARPTPVTHGTATATATTIPATPTPQIGSQILFFDDFLDNNNGWYISDSANYTRTLEDGQLTITSTNHQLLVESLPTNTTFTDFSLSMNFTLEQADKNDSIGLYLRGDSNLDHDYRVDIYGDSAYSISKESISENNQQAVKTLVDHTSTPWLKPNGKSNTLTIMMKGPDLVLMLNGAIVKTISDSDYTRGQIALFVNNGNTSQIVSATINSIVIYSAPNHMPI
jgi:hypothetical protein